MNANCNKKDQVNDTTILGNSVDVNLCHIEDSEIRADVVVKQIKAKRIWGQVVDCDGQPVGSVLVKLVKVVCRDGKKDYVGVAHTIADCTGFYQFDLCPDDKACYRILVSKAVTGGETVIQTQGGNCNPCYQYQDCRTNPQAYCSPCMEYPVNTMPYDKNGCSCPSPRYCDDGGRKDYCPNNGNDGCSCYSDAPENVKGTNYATYNNY